MDSQEILKKILEGLSDDQKNAVTSDAGYIRVIAGAGAGKTETLTRRILYLFLVQGVDPSSIVAFTFTERAAEAMKSRIYVKVRELDETKVGRLGEMYIGTIHAFAKRVLDDRFGYGNHTVLDENQEIAFLMRHGWDIGINEFEHNYSEACKKFLRTVNMVWNEVLDRDLLKSKAPVFYSKLDSYERLLEENKLLTFGLMIHLVVKKIRENPGILSEIRYLIVDEYQDINTAQEELIRLIGKNSSVFVVGDPRQSIYQWRGSDERFFHKFDKAFSGAYTVSINENRRSCTKIVKNANKFASTLKSHYEPMIAVRNKEGFIGLIEFKTRDEEANWIADKIEQLKSRGLSYSDIGILTRSIRLDANPLIDELKKRRIPYIVGGKVGLFKRDEAQALGRIFAWFYERGFWVDNPSRWDKKITGDELLKTALDHWRSAYQYKVPDDAELVIRKIKDRIYSDESNYDNFTSLYQDVLNALGFKSLDHRDPNDAAILANLGRFNNLLTDYETANRIGGKKPNWKKDLKGLCWFMNGYASSAYEELATEDVLGVDAVQIMTIHQAKGLEWPIVFIFAVTDNRFPPAKVGKRLDWCGIPRDMFDASRYEGTLDDERRLFYVAITRARDALLISYFKNEEIDKSIFIDDLDLAQVSIIRDLPADLDIESSESSDSILTLTANDITSYLTCPYMFLLRNVYGYQPGLNEAIDFGKGIHFCLRRATEILKDNKEASPITAATMAVEKDFFMQLVKGKRFNNYKTNAKKRIITYVEAYGNDLKESDESEYRIEFPLQMATITGRVDIISNKEVRDYKTLDYKDAVNSIHMMQTETQLRLYALGLKSLGKPVEKASVAFLGDEETKVVEINIGQEKLNDTEKAAQHAIDSIKSRKFDANSGKHCLSCDMRNICRWRSDEQ